MKEWILIGGMVLASCGGDIAKKPGGEPNNQNNANNQNNVNNANNLNNVNNGSVCLSVAAGLGFSEIFIGDQETLQASVENCGEESVLFDVETGSPEFQLQEGNTELPAGATTVLQVTFAPMTAGNKAATLELLVDGVVVSDMALTGTAIDPDSTCPIARAVATDGQGQAGDDITVVGVGRVAFLDGAGSSAIVGDIDSFSWSVVMQPANSSASIDSPTSAITELSVDMPGDYVIGLTVTDTQQEENCIAETVTIRVEPSPEIQDLVFQIVWDTPLDPDQTDANGADVDLQILNLSLPNAAWDTAPFSCFWNNANADWGIPGPDNNCTLDIDDADGAGPENYSITTPEPILYGVGVNYFSDRGFGPSTVTLRISRGGVMVGEYIQQLQNTGQFWYVGDFDAASGTLIGNGAISDRFPN